MDKDSKNRGASGQEESRPTLPDWFDPKRHILALVPSADMVPEGASDYGMWRDLMEEEAAEMADRSGPETEGED